MAEENRASSGPFAADEVRSTPGVFGAVPVERGVERGTGVADSTGRLLWADDTFCTILGRRRERILGTQLADVLTLDLRATAGATISTGLVPVPAEPQAQTPRVTALCGREGRPWAFVVELENLTGESIAPSAPLVAAFVLDGEGSLAAVWGPSTELVGLGRADLDRAVVGVPEGVGLFSNLIRRALDGEVVTGIVTGQEAGRELHLFPAEDPEGGPPGAVGVAITVSDRSPPDRSGLLDRQTALTELARVALGGVEVDGLLEETARLVHRTLGAAACAIFEYLPGSQGLLLRAAVDWPAWAPRVIPAAQRAVSHRPQPGDPWEGALVMTIDRSPPFGCLAVHLDEHHRLNHEEVRFIEDAVDIVTVALRRLLSDEGHRHAALHDPLTGLPNRALILDHLRLALARAERQLTPAAVIFLDLGRFKLINDTLGHEAGDELLVAVAQRLLGALRPTDTIARLGGDEFMVVCEDFGGEADALVVANRLAATFMAPFPLNGADVSVTASIGVAVSRMGATSPAGLLAEADTAMYRAKQHQRTTGVVLFKENLRPHPTRGVALDEPQDTASAPEPPRSRLRDLALRLTSMLEEASHDPLDLPAAND